MEQGSPSSLPNLLSTPIPPASSGPPTKHFLTAAGEMVLLELLPWIYDRYALEADYAHISWHTVSENFKAGFGYDSDHFNVNQSQHPYQGGLFFEAGRSNGYDFWESSLFALTGSLIWECCMENTRPSINDLVNTTLGGMTRGEVSHRLAAMILDNTASGSDRLWREVGAAVINPVGAFTRLVRGDAARDFPNPEERFPGAFSVSADLGYRRVSSGDERLDQASVSLSARYGDPFAGDLVKPFDSFWAAIDLNFPGGTALSAIEERGILKGWELSDPSAPVRHIFGFSQEYEYFNNLSQVFGAEILSAGLLSRYALGRSLVATTDVGVLAMPLAGVKTTDFNSPSTGRNYDYGPGGGLRAAVRIYGGGAEILSAGYGVGWIHTVNGVSDNNTLQFFRATARVPIVGPLGAGAGYSWYSRKTTYAGFFEARAIQSEWRAFLTLGVGASGLRTPKD
jgi:hypothetical protein